MAGRGLFGLFQRHEEAQQIPARVPHGVLLYAIGDVHGRYDLLTALLAKIDADTGGFPDTRRILVFVGDYVDRGPASRKVIELAAAGVPGFETVCLKGNHEQILLGFLNDPEHWEIWRRLGGLDTLASYGVDPRLLLAAAAPVAEIREAFARVLPPSHLEFLRTLKTNFDCGDYHFVHAGVRPGIPLSRQVETDQLWIREAFLEAQDDFEGRVIVHGHTPRPGPERLRSRIGIDTGAYFSGRLTAARFFADTVEFLQN